MSINYLKKSFRASCPSRNTLRWNENEVCNLKNRRRHSMEKLILLGSLLELNAIDFIQDFDSIAKF